jgi:hypothetical protein
MPQKTPHLYIPWLQKMLLDVQAHVSDELHGCRAWTLLPQKTARPVFVTVSNTILGDITRYLKEHKVYLTNEERWQAYFNLKTICSSQRTFEPIFRTDAMSVSALVARPHFVSEGNGTSDFSLVGFTPRTTEDILPSRVVALDPGRRNLFTGVVLNPAAVDTLASPSHEMVPFETFKMTRGEWYDICGNRKRHAKVKKWASESPGVSSYNEGVPTAKVGDFLAYADHVRFVLRHINALISLYGARHYRRLRWKTYIRKQKAWKKLVDRITDGRPQETLVIFGDASFASCGRGSKSVPTKTVRRMVGNACHRIVDQDEFRTSRLCSSCHGELKGERLRGKDGEVRESYGVRRCQSANCHRTVWDRDTNAAINILLLYLRSWAGLEKPEVFVRSRDRILGGQTRAHA